MKPFKRATKVEEYDQSLALDSGSKVFIYQGRLFRTYTNSSGSHLSVWHRELQCNNLDDPMVNGMFLGGQLNTSGLGIYDYLKYGHWWLNDGTPIKDDRLKYDDLVAGIHTYFKSGIELHIVDYLNGLFGE